MEQNKKIEQLDLEIQKLKSEIMSINEKLDNDNKRINGTKDGERVLMRSVLALMTHAIDGNHVEELKEAKKEMESFLIKENL